MGLHDIAIYNWNFLHRHFVASNWNAGCSGYLDNFKILSILTFNCGFLCKYPYFLLWFSLCLGLEKLWRMPLCNYVLFKLLNFVFTVVWRFTLFCPFCGSVYQRSTSGNPACSEFTAILRESNTVHHLKDLSFAEGVTLTL